MDLEVIILNEISHTKKGKLYICNLYVKSKEIMQMNIYTVNLYTETDWPTWKTNLDNYLQSSDPLKKKKNGFVD